MFKMGKETKNQTSNPWDLMKSKSQEAEKGRVCGLGGEKVSIRELVS